MNGRTETNYKFEKQVRELITDQPLLIQQFAEFRLSTDQPYSVKEYVFNVIHFNNWLKKERNYELSPETVNQILPMDCSQFLGSVRYKTKKDGTRTEYSTAYRATIWSSINSFFRFCKANRILKSENPMDDVKRPKNTDQIPTDHLQKIEIKQVIAYIKAENENTKLRDLCIMSMLLTYGVRAQCLMNVNVEDVDLKNNVITFTDKGDKTFSRSINPELHSYLERYLAERNADLQRKKLESPALFISTGNSRMTYTTLRRIVNYYTSRIGHKLSPHAMRKSYASIVYKASGSDIRYTQKMLNHSNINTTTRYINEVNEEQDRKVSSVLQNLM